MLKKLALGFAMAATVLVGNTLAETKLSFALDWKFAGPSAP